LQIGRNSARRASQKLAPSDRLVAGGTMPPRVRDLIKQLEKAGFYQRAGRGSHRNFTHPRCPRVLTLSGADGDDAKPYQVAAVRRALQEVRP